MRTSAIIELAYTSWCTNACISLGSCWYDMVSNLMVAMTGRWSRWQSSGLSGKVSLEEEQELRCRASSWMTQLTRTTTQWSSSRKRKPGWWMVSTTVLSCTVAKSLSVLTTCCAKLETRLELASSNNNTVRSYVHELDTDTFLRSWPWSRQFENVSYLIFIKENNNLYKEKITWHKITSKDRDQGELPKKISPDFAKQNPLSLFQRPCQLLVCASMSDVGM